MPFEEFRQRVERPRFGVVFTAHPTFALAKGLQEALVELALGVTAAGQALDDEAATRSSGGSSSASTGPTTRSISTRSIASR